MKKLLNQHEAAQLLGVSARAIRDMESRGELFKVNPGRHGQEAALYRREDIAALREAREGRYDFNAVVGIALQARSRARALEEKVKVLERALAMDVALDTDEQSVVALYADAQDALECPPTDPPEVTRWADVFVAMSEQYLGLMTAYCGEDVWELFQDLGAALVEATPVEKLKTERVYEVAYKYLDVGIRNLRNALFLYVRANYGDRHARKAFHDTPTDSESKILRLVALMTGQDDRK